MKDNVTQSLTSLHSWSGLLFGWVLFAVFLTGTLTVFDNEITSWMQPELQEVTSVMDDVDISYPVMELAWQADHSDVSFQSARAPIFKVKWQDKRTFSGQTIDPRTGRMLTIRDTQGGDFFYHFHYGLLFGVPGAWIVGIGGVAMLMALVTGLSIHRRGLKDFMTLYPRPFSQRAWLDAHNMSGILVLPFHLLMTVTGLLILWSIFMPGELQFLSGGGLVLSVLSDLHFVQFGGAAMRWLYFVMGLAASVMIATGLLLWTNKRRKYYADGSGVLSYRLVESLNVASVAGLLVSIAAFFWANRLLPMALIGRSVWEVRCFFVVWCFCLVHSLLRRGSTAAWSEQLYVAALLLGTLPLLNVWTTNSHLLMTVPKGQWALASIDLTALAAGLLLVWTARRLGHAVVKA